MAQNNQNAKIGRQYVPVTPQITTLQVRMAAQDIRNWKQAIDQARSILNPRRQKLYEMYDIIKLDGHLISVMNKRKVSVTNQKVHFNLKGQDGVIDEMVRDAVLETPWFYKMIGLLCDSKPFGHSLVEIIPDKGVISDVKLIPRANVKPEKGFVAWNISNDQSGFYYREDPQYSRYMIEMGAPDDYGLLMVAAQYVIYKRGGFGDWAQFAELFGMPFREGQYDAWDEEGRLKLEDALSKMGGAGWVVTPKGTELKFHDNNGAGKSEVFKDLIDMCNAEMSKIFLGNTMTTDNGSSKSQGEVHKEVEEDINLSDMIEMEYLLNWTISKQLQLIGYPIPEGRFFYPQMQDIPLDKRLEMDVMLADKINIDPAYWYNTYGIPKPGDGILIKTPAPTPDPTPDPKAPEPPAPAPTPGQKKKPDITAVAIAKPYQDNCDCGHSHPQVTAEGLTDIENQLLQELYNGHVGSYDPATMQMNLDKLRRALFTHLPPTAEYGTPDHLASTMMEANINRFGFDKSVSQVYELNKALNMDETFNEFKQKANGILEAYNHTYLQTEYDFAIATGQNAAAWNRQKRQANLFPYLKYMTAGDDRVRPAHAALDGKLFRVDDHSWTGIYPPNGWNCRCEMVQVETADGGDVIDGPIAKGLLGEEWNKMEKGGFDKNRGDLNQVFDLNKSYIKQLPAKARINPDKLTYADAGLPTVENMMSTAPVIPAKVTNTTVEFAKTTFAEKSKLYKDEMSMFFSDYSGRQIRLGQDVFEGHLNEHYITPEENRHGLFTVLPELFQNPTEVWMREYKAKTFQYRFLKVFNGLALVADLAFEGDGLLLKTWYIMKAADEVIRNGFPVK